MLEESIPSHQTMLDEIASARSQGRLELPQLPMRARAAWKRLEGRLAALEGALQEDGGTLTETVVASVRELTRSAQDILQRARAPHAMLEQPVDAIMTSEPVTCSPGDDLGRAAQIMWDHDTGLVPIVDGEGKVVGLLTDRDVCMAAHLRGEPLRHVRVDSAMSKCVHACRPDDTIAHALEVMRRERVRRLPVLAAGGNLLGVVTLGDVARRIDPRSTAGAEVVRALTAISAPAPLHE